MATGFGGITSLYHHHRRDSATVRLGCSGLIVKSHYGLWLVITVLAKWLLHLDVVFRHLPASKLPVVLVAVAALYFGAHSMICWLAGGGFGCNGSHLCERRFIHAGIRGA